MSLRSHHVICTLGKSVRVEINRFIFSHETTSIILRLSGDDDYLSDHTGTQDGPWRRWHEDRRSIYSQSNPLLGQSAPSLSALCVLFLNNWSIKYPKVFRECNSEVCHLVFAAISVFTSSLLYTPSGGRSPPLVGYD